MSSARHWLRRIAVVSAFAVVGGAAIATPAFASTVPAAPHLDSVHFVHDSSNSQTGAIRVTWTAGSDGGSAITEYRVYEGSVSGHESLAMFLTPTGTTQSWDFPNGGFGNVVYHFVVTAINSIGESAWSNEYVSSFNLVSGEFSASTTGWNGNVGGAITSGNDFSGSHGSAGVMVNTQQSGISESDSNDSPDSVQDSSVYTGLHCTFSGMVKTAGNFKLRIREYASVAAGGALLGTPAISALTSGGSTWTSATTSSYTVVGGTNSRLDFNVIHTGLSTNDQSLDDALWASCDDN
jgi:hypothetical protein